MKTRLTTIAVAALLGRPFGTTLGTARAGSAADADAFAAEAALSARYTELWTQMPAAARPEFSRAERHWLHVQRWEEQQRCRSAAQPTPAAPAPETAARCLAQVTLRRLAHLRDGLPPAGAGAATTASIAAR
ncbi:MAG: hypothetical protein U5L03_06205 [Burkholderiaceae bacterium]|nr:hypothetical protein [Burkholderiaceae bacterium]